MKLTKQNREDIEQYILKAIDTDGYDSYTADVVTDKERLAFVLSTFKAEYGWAIKKQGELKAFAEWLGGLPSCINIDYNNFVILDLAEKWGQRTDTEARADKILNGWFDFIAHQTFKLMKKRGVE
jgi:hypothetical protein